MTDWSRLVKPSLGGVEPYDPGESLSELKARYGLSEVVKLNWNEGLFGPGPGVLEAAAAELQNAWMYPEQAYADLRDAVAEWRGVRPRQVVPGHGIQALVATVAAAFIGPGTPVVVADADVRPLRAGLCRGRREDRARTGSSRSRSRPGGARRDGTARGRPARPRVRPEQPDRRLDRGGRVAGVPGPVPEGCVAVVDEAYAEYVDPELRLRREDDIDAGRPVLILRTFSKLFGLAGLRLGYAVCSEELAHYLHVVQEPFNVNRAALAAGQASLAVPGLPEERRRQAAEARELLSRRLAEAGAEPHPSQANFVLAGVGVDDVELTERLLSTGAPHPGRQRVRARRNRSHHGRSDAADGARGRRAGRRPRGAARCRAIGRGTPAPTISRMPETVGVTLEGVSKRFGDVEAVRNVSLDVGAGEFFSLLGPSGCGKTTSLRMIAGFELPDEGRILLGAEDVTETPPHKRPVNTVFQSYALFPHLNVGDNVASAFASRTRRRTKSAACRRRSRPRAPRRASSGASLTSSPAASSSAWRSPARSCSSRRCSCSTSRWAR